MEEPRTPPLEAAAAVEEPPARFRFQTFSSLRHLDYRYLWTSTLLMSAGQWIQQLTLGWLLYDLTGSSVLLGALNGLRAVPFLFFGPLAGVAADRMDRRWLMLVTQYVLLIATLTIGVLVASGWLEVWHLFLFTVISGTAWSFSEPVRQSLVPNLVPKTDLMNAIALHSSGFNLMKVVGPSLGGLLIVWFGAAGNFFVQSAAYLGVLITIYLMHVPPTPDEARRSSVSANLREGLLYVVSNPIVLTLMITALVPRIFAVPYQALMPVFQKDVLKVGPDGLGMMLAAPGAGAVLTTLTLASVAQNIRRKGLLLLGGMIFLGIFLILFSQTTSFWLAILLLVGVGGFQVLFMATANTMLQLAVPDGLRGRVLSIYNLDRGLMPAGALMAGVTAHFVGAPVTVGIMGLVVIVLALVVAWSVPLLREFET